MRTGQVKLGLLLLLLWGMLGAGQAEAQAHYRLWPKDPAELAEGQHLVRRWCRMDFMGFRLDSESWKRMQALTMFEEEPSWTAFEVVSDFELLPPERDPNWGQVLRVRYAVLGRFEMGVGYTPLRRAGEAVFRFGLQDDKLRISEIYPSAIPRIGRARTLSWLRQSLEQEQDPRRQRILRQAIQELQ